MNNILIWNVNKPRDRVHVVHFKYVVNEEILQRLLYDASDLI